MSCKTDTRAADNGHVRNVSVTDELRELCRREYGDEFAKDYDTLNAGGVIGGFAETAAFLSMVEAVKDKHKGKWRKA